VTERGKKKEPKPKPRPHCLGNKATYFPKNSAQKSRAIPMVQEAVIASCSLRINPDKTKLLVIGVPQLMRTLPSIPPVKLLGKEIEPVTVAKDLGVMIYPSLCYNERVLKTISNCRYRLMRINRIKHLLDRKTLLMLIKTNVRKLQLVQNFAGRIVLGLRKYDHISKDLKSLRWLSVSDTLVWYDSIVVHKYMNGGALAILLTCLHVD